MAEGAQAQWEVEVGGEGCREHPLRGTEQAGSLSRAGCTGPGRACPPAGLWGAPLGRLGWVGVLLLTHLPCKYRCSGGHSSVQTASTAPPTPSLPNQAPPRAFHERPNLCFELLVGLTSPRHLNFDMSDLTSSLPARSAAFLQSPTEADGHHTPDR